ncbi:MAG: DUF3352 domain-containing protein [Leptolyngbyaceae cyanobacterium CSU_1_3]|nr:DUF3352 domain-containing protein [Leptolyngbyaceae cyanobacterium CSU_1_3]
MAARKPQPPCQPSAEGGESVTFAPKGRPRVRVACAPNPLGQAIQPFLAATKSEPMPSPTPTAPGTTQPEPPQPDFSLLAPQGFTIAILPNYVVTSNTVGAIEQLIDAQATGKLLADNPAFQRMAQKPQFSKSLVAGYGDYKQILAASSNFNQESFKKMPPGFPVPRNFDPAQLDLLGKYYDAIDGYLWAEPDGMHLKFGVHFKESLPQSMLDSLKTPNEILGRLPEVNYVVSNSYNLAIFWQFLTNGMEAEPTLKKTLGQFRQFSQKNLGIDDRDIFPWFNGEYATFMYPTRQGFAPSAIPNFDLSLGIMVQTRDRPMAEAALQKIDQIARTRIGKDVVQTRKLQGQPVTTWELPLKGKPQPFLSHSWIDEDTVLILGGGGSMAEFNPKPARTLPQSANFKAAIAPFTDANLGYFYVNNGAVMTVVNNLFLPLLLGTSAEGNRFVNELRDSLGSVRSLSASSSLTANNMQSDGFLALATTRTTPITASELFELGNQKLSDSNADEAIADFTRILRLEPANAQAYSKRGDARLASADSSGAIADYSQALKIDSNNAETYQSRARAYSSLFDYQNSLADWNQVIQFRGGDLADAYLSRAGVRGALDDYKGAIADADQAIRLNPENGAAYNIRCYARARGLSDFKGALADCDKAIDFDSESSDNYASRCYVRANLGDKKALQDCDAGLALDSESPSLYEDRGLAHAALGNKKAALADLQKATQLYNEQGNTLAEQRTQRAIAAIEKK